VKLIEQRDPGTPAATEARLETPPDSSVNTCFAKGRGAATAYDHHQGRRSICAMAMASMD
jgi:hypothetical protein